MPFGGTPVCGGKASTLAVSRILRGSKVLMKSKIEAAIASFVEVSRAQWCETSKYRILNSRLQSHIPDVTVLNYLKGLAGATELLFCSLHGEAELNSC